MNISPNLCYSSVVILTDKGIKQSLRFEESEAKKLRGGEAWEAGNPDYLLDGLGIVKGFGVRSYFVAAISRTLANEIVRRFHYSGRVVVGSPIHLGVFSRGRLDGVLQFGYPMNIRATSKYVAGATLDSFLELNRMWLDDCLPTNSESRALAFAMRFIRRTRPRTGFIQSFADERCRGLGAVYQAANFVFCGSHLSPFWELDGEIYHNILMTHLERKAPRALHLRANRHRAIKRTFRQFRYIYFLKPHLARRLTLPILPFPKAEQDSRASRLASSKEGGVQIPGSALTPRCPGAT